MTTKPATAIKMTLTTTPGQQQPDAGQESQRRRDDPAPVMHPRVGRAHRAGEPPVAGV
jgi:hypothetical protein